MAETFCISTTILYIIGVENYVSYIIFYIVIDKEYSLYINILLHKFIT